MNKLLFVALLAGCNGSTALAPSDGGAGDLAAADLAPLPPLTASIACTDQIADVYVANSALPAYTPADRGKIVRCALDGMLTAAQVQQRAATAGYSGPMLGSGAQALRVAYRTERLAGQGGVGTAEIYLPMAPRVAPAEAVAAVHGTIGLADLCAPTKLGGVGADAMAMPLVGNGLAVIAPDYAGLGNGHGETYQGWDIAEDEAHSVLDAVRALRSSVPAGALTAQTALVGHSQGGGSVFAAQALAKTYAPELPIAAVVGFAPGWYDRRAWGQALAAANRGTSTSGNNAFLAGLLAMYYFGHSAVYDGVTHATDAFATGVRTQVKTAMDTQCINSIGTQIAGFAPTVGDLFDATFSASVEACVSGTGTCASPGMDWIMRMDADRPTLDATGAPVLIIQGLNDVIVLPAASGCTYQRLKNENINVQACTDPNADHLTVPGADSAYALQFIESRLAGGSGKVDCTNGLPMNCANP
jgi:pimeloyl-ACP methyl ester carboxylesterase